MYCNPTSIWLLFLNNTLTFFLIYAKVTTVYMSNAMTRRSTYRTGSQREDGGENLQLGCMEVAFEQWTEKHNFL